MNFKATLIPLLLISGFLAVSFAEKPMLMKTPTNANELNALGITTASCVSKAKLSAQWLKTKFHIKDERIVTEILESNQRWTDPCACPYNLDEGMKTQSRCGGRSHYSRTNSFKLKCYPKDVLYGRSLAKGS